jgi:drug/metabolite transporter (DMT)-like permease
VSLQTLYYALLAAAYRSTDMSHAYPIMRGTAPLIVAAVSAWLIGEIVSATQWLGIVLICGGVLGLAVHAPAQSGRHASATAFALVDAGVIVSYTVIDGLGVRRSGAPVAYTMWIFLLTGTEMLLWISVWRRRGGVAARLRPPAQPSVVGR